MTDETKPVEGLDDLDTIADLEAPAELQDSVKGGVASNVKGTVTSVPHVLNATS